MNPIFIIGYMGAGKSTFGKALAREIGVGFIDLDFYIRQRFRKSIPEIFAERGEEGFRRIETNMLREVGEFSDVVIACGGGAPCFNGNIDYMLSKGTVVCMRASKERLLDRLCANTSQRPALQGKSREEIAAIMEQGLRDRAVHYDRAPIQFDGDELEDRRQIAGSVRRFLLLHPLL